MHPSGERTESRRDLLRRLGMASALVWTVPMITSAAPVQSRSPAETAPVCPGTVPSLGHCTSSNDCFPGSCEFVGCTPSHCYCGPDGNWHCTNDCLGHCLI